MKKRLEAELISIAHRVLKLKNKSEIDQLYLETRKLYETLSVLKFYGDNYEQVKSEITQEDLEDKLTSEKEEKLILEVETKPTEVVIEEPVAEAMPEVEVIDEIDLENEDSEIEDEEEVIEEVEVEEEEEEFAGEIENEDGLPKPEIEEINFEPIFELAPEAAIEDVVEEKVNGNKSEAKQISFEDLLGENYNEPVFIKPNEVVIPPSLKSVLDEKPMSLNDQHSKAINIGMNDRIAFVKHLFADSDEDYNRVLSQLNTFDAQEEALDFIENIIKPDYNNWEGSEEYSERFMEIIENKFN
ncbi:hypothetical protein [Flavobacterium sp.]|uniref:hypothetical protein n=1 Tax=Flavobacterium sp. TaxID=239 RepID=UPI003BBA6F13